MHFFTCNDTRKVPGLGQGSLLRSGRAFLYLGKSGHKCLRFGWSWFNNLYWPEVCLRFSMEDGVTFTLILPWLLHTYLSLPLPMKWLSWWMTEDREFSFKLFYVGRIFVLSLAYAQHAEDCGMTDYYRREKPRRYSNLQLWPGWSLGVRWPPLLDWMFGRKKYNMYTVETRPVTLSLDGRQFEGTWSLQRWDRSRPRWPWKYHTSVGSYLEVKNPPQFAGKGENSWDCGDDAIYGMGSSETTPAGAIGEYVKAVLKNRERYGLPSELRGALCPSS